MRNLIAKHAFRLKMPGGDSKVNRAQLLAAICMNESSGGRRNLPNFEPAFFVGGKLYNAAVVEKLVSLVEPELKDAVARAAACSWGPFQVMWQVAVELGYNAPPWALWRPDSSLIMAITYLNKREMPHLQDTEPALKWVERCLDSYNSGTSTDNIVPTKYVQDGLAHYQDPGLLEKLVVYPGTL